MPKIEFRGKTYNNELEMPFDVRQAYNEEKERSNQKKDASATSLTDVVEMSPQLKEILIPGENWKLVGEGYKFTEGPATNAKGEVFFNDVGSSMRYKVVEC